MEWRTNLKLKEANKKINYNSKLMLLGSCFSSEIGNKLDSLKFNCSVNPKGISFNPISIFNSLKDISYSEENLAKIEDIYLHFNFHSKFYSQEKSKLISQLQEIHSEYKSKVKSLDWLVITLGSSIVHELNGTKEIVANCHKQPKTDFTKRYLTIEEIITSFREFHTELNPKTQILINVSPIRHTKEGLAENQLSKSILRVACNEIQNHFENVTYLPTYEIMIDDLRDYRFYKSDLIHPSDEAVNHIFNMFKESYFSSETILEMNKVEKLLLEMNHKPLFPESQSHTAFKNSLMTKLNNSAHDFSLEIKSINS